MRPFMALGGHENVHFWWRAALETSCHFNFAGWKKNSPFNTIFMSPLTNLYTACSSHPMCWSRCHHCTESHRCSICIICSDLLWWVKRPLNGHQYLSAKQRGVEVWEDANYKERVCHCLWSGCVCVVTRRRGASGNGINALAFPAG